MGLMRMIGIAAAAAAVLLTALPLRAHHSFAAEFDAKRPVKLQGSVTRVEWINPHSWIHIEVTKANGSKENWMVEGGTPNTLFRRGFTRDALKAGTVIVVEGFRAKDGSLRANGRDVTFPDGRKLFLGSSGTGAPGDGRDPTESQKR